MKLELNPDSAREIGGERVVIGVVIDAGGVDQHIHPRRAGPPSATTLAAFVYHTEPEIGLIFAETF